MKYVLLSHVLAPSTPGYGGEQGFFSEPHKAICCGDSSNSQRWNLVNHIGTHVDCPLHFFEHADAVDSYSAEDWVFTNPCLVDYPCALSEIVYPKEGFVEQIDTNADLLLVRTGFEGRRGQEEYWRENPAFSPELAEYLRAKRPNIRAIGFDGLSLTGYQHRPLGREAHKAFLNPASPGKPILIIEDMALAHLSTSPSEVIVLPLRVAGADGGPVTVLARVCQ